MSADVLERPGAADPRLPAVLASEARVWLTSSLWWFVAAAATWSLISAVLLVHTGATGWDRFLAFQNLWVVAIGPASTAVLAGWLSHAAASCRRGATSFRGVAPWRRRLGLTVVVWGWSTAAHAAVLGVAVMMYAISGSGEVPLTAAVVDAARVTVVLALSSIGLTALLVVVGEVAGLLGCALVGVVFAATGALTAESWWWWSSPPAWQVRPTLTLIGTHANGVALEGQTVDGTPLALALALSFAIAVLALAPVVTGVATRTSQVALAPGTAASPPPGAARGRVRGGQTTSVVMIVRRSGALTLAVVGVLATLALLRWRPAGEVGSFWALIVLPLGSAVVPVLWIPRLRSGLRAAAMRRPRPVGWGCRLVLLMLVLVGASSTVVVIGLATAGMAAGTAVLFGAVLCSVGCLLVSLSAWLVTAVGVFGCLFTTSCGVTVGLLVASNEDMTTRLGYFVPWAWASYLDTQHLTITVPLALAGTVVAAPLAARGITAGPARRP